MAEAKISEFVAILRIIRNTDLSVLCPDCKRWKIQAVLALIRGVEERLGDEDKGGCGASGSGTGAC